MARAEREADTIVLCYHAISYTWQADLATTPYRLERQLRLLLDRGYRARRFSEAVTSPSNTPTLVVTFDDAYSSVVELGMPVLDRLGIPATVFAPTDWIGRAEPMAWPGIDRWLGGPFERELSAVGWRDLSELAGAGWEIGSHTCSHPHLTMLDDASLLTELESSKQTCEEHLGAPCTSIAYPYGDVDERVATAAGRAGYLAGASLQSHLKPAGLLRRPRIGVYQADNDTRFRAKVAAPARSVRRSAAWGLFARAREG